jgi:hypothetical protein
LKAFYSAIVQAVIGLKILANTNKENNWAILYQRRKLLPRNTITLGGYLRMVRFQWRKGKGKSIWTKAITTKATIARTTLFRTLMMNKLS